MSFFPSLEIVSTVASSVGRGVAAAARFIWHVVGSATSSVAHVTQAHYRETWGRVGSSEASRGYENFSTAELIFASVVALPLALAAGIVPVVISSTVRRFFNATQQTWRLENPLIEEGEDLTLGQHLWGVLGNTAYLLVGAIVGVSVALQSIGFAFKSIGKSIVWSFEKAIPEEEMVANASEPESKSSERSFSQALASRLGVLIGTPIALLAGAMTFAAVGLTRVLNQTFWVAAALIESVVPSVWNFNLEGPSDYPGKGKSWRQLTVPRVLGYALGVPVGLMISAMGALGAGVTRAMMTITMGVVESTMRTVGKVFERSKISSEIEADLRSESASRWKRSRSLSYFFLPTNWLGYAVGAVAGVAAGSVAVVVGNAHGLIQALKWGYHSVIPQDPASQSTDANEFWFNSPWFPLNYPGRFLGGVLGLGAAFCVVNVKSFWVMTLRSTAWFFEKAVNTVKESASNAGEVKRSFLHRAGQALVHSLGYFMSGITAIPLVGLAAVIVHSASILRKGLVLGRDIVTKAEIPWPTLSLREKILGIPGILLTTGVTLTIALIGQVGMSLWRGGQGIARGFHHALSVIQEGGQPRTAEEESALPKGPGAVGLTAEKIGRVLGGCFAGMLGIIYAAQHGVRHLFGKVWDLGLSSDVPQDYRYQFSKEGSRWDSLSLSRRTFYWATSLLVAPITLPLAGALLMSAGATRLMSQSIKALALVTEIAWTRTLPSDGLFKNSTHRVFRGLGLMLGGVALGALPFLISGTISVMADIARGIGEGFVPGVSLGWNLQSSWRSEIVPANKICRVGHFIGGLMGGFTGWSARLFTENVLSLWKTITVEVEMAWTRTLPQEGVLNDPSVSKKFRGVGIVLGAVVGTVPAFIAGVLSIGVDSVVGWVHGFCSAVDSGWEWKSPAWKPGFSEPNSFHQLTHPLGALFGSLLGGVSRIVADNLVSLGKAVGAVLSGGFGLKMADSFSEDTRTLAHRVVGTLGTVAGVILALPFSSTIRLVRFIPNLASIGLALAFSPLVAVGKFLAKIVSSCVSDPQIPRYSGVSSPQAARFRALFSGLNYRGELNPGLNLNLQASGRRSGWRTLFKVFTFNATSKTEQIIKEVYEKIKSPAVGGYVPLPEAPQAQSGGDLTINGIVDTVVAKHKDHIEHPECFGSLRNSTHQDELSEVEYVGTVLKKALTAAPERSTGSIAIHTKAPVRAAEAFSFWSLCVGSRSHARDNAAELNQERVA